jgi:hypothetical protein
LLEKPYLIRLPNKRHVWADIEFGRNLKEIQQQLIILEVKCFEEEGNDLPELYRAVGQYQFYKSALSLLPDPPLLYLTIPKQAYNRFQKRPEIMLTLKTAQIRYVIIDIELEEIIEWVQ